MAWGAVETHTESGSICDGALKPTLLYSKGLWPCHSPIVISVQKELCDQESTGKTGFCQGITIKRFFSQTDLVLDLRYVVLVGRGVIVRQAESEPEPAFLSNQ